MRIRPVARLLEVSLICQLSMLRQALDGVLKGHTPVVTLGLSFGSGFRGLNPKP